MKEVSYGKTSIGLVRLEREPDCTLVTFIPYRLIWKMEKMTWKDSEQFMQYMKEAAFSVKTAPETMYSGSALSDLDMRQIIRLSHE